MRPLPRLLLTFAWLSLSACAQAAAYSITDSSTPASRDGDVAWLDNHRVLFYQLNVSKNKARRALEPFIWDTVNKSASPYPALQGAAKVRVCGEFGSPRTARSMKRLYPITRSWPERPVIFYR